LNTFIYIIIPYIFICYFSSSRQNYGDSAIGYVCLKRENSICTVKAKVCPEHRVRNKAYSVILTVDEKIESIINVECHDCAASSGRLLSLIYNLKIF